MDSSHKLAFICAINFIISSLHLALILVSKYPMWHEQIYSRWSKIYNAAMGRRPPFSMIQVIDEAVSMDWIETSRRDGAREPQRNLGLVPTASATATPGAFMLFKLAKLAEASIFFGERACEHEHVFY